MFLRLDNTSGRPIYEQLFEQIRACILRQELKEGDALPSIRLLAKEMRISVITTKRAYEELEQAGYIVSVPGKGSYVAPQNTQKLRAQHQKQAEEHLQKAARAAHLAGLDFDGLSALLLQYYEQEGEHERDTERSRSDEDLSR